MLHKLRRWWAEARKRWELVGADGEHYLDTDEIHVVPMADARSHDTSRSGICSCKPTTELHTRADGSAGWLLTHSAWDGRE